MRSCMMRQSRARGGSRTIDLDTLGDEQLLWVDLTGDPSVVLPQQMQAALGLAENMGALEIFDSFDYSVFPCVAVLGSCLRFAVGKSWGSPRAINDRSSLTSSLRPTRARPSRGE